jgi:hypothetical protein
MELRLRHCSVVRLQDRRIKAGTVPVAGNAELMQRTESRIANSSVHVQTIH